MSWYYASGGEQKGPIEESALRTLRGGGEIADDTLVWKEGMGDWKPYAEVIGAAPESAGGEDPAAGAGAMVTCAYSGKSMPREGMIKYGDAWVAAEHKDAFVQRLKEGGDGDAGQMEYAGFWTRVAAKMIDWIAAGTPLAVPYILAYMKFISISMQPEPDTEQVTFWLGIVALCYIFMIVGQIVYTTWMVGRFEATLGKLALGIKVVNADGSRVSYMKAFGRFWGEVVTNFTMMIGYLIVAFDDEKRSLHDHICSTRVVRK